MSILPLSDPQRIGPEEPETWRCYRRPQEAAAHAVNAAIRRAGLEGRRKTNPVVDGQLVPRVRTKKANGHGPKALRKRRRDEQAAATPSPRARRR